MKKYNFDIEINDTPQVSGGYLLTIENKTKKQAVAEMERIGRKLLKSNPYIEYASYSAWEAEPENLESWTHVTVILRRDGRKIEITTL